jgi:hypothetical protein
MNVCSVVEFKLNERTILGQFMQMIIILDLLYRCIFHLSTLSLQIVCLSFTALRDKGRKLISSEQLGPSR